MDTAHRTLDPRELFERYLTIDAPFERMAFVFANPPLLHHENLIQLGEELVPDDTRRPVVDKLAVLLKHVVWRPEDWHLPRGPIHELLERVLAGRLPVAAAVREAETPSIAQALCPAYVAAVLGAAAREADAGNARRAMLSARLVLAAVAARDAAGGPGGPLASTIRGFVDVTVRAAARLGDASIRDEAVAALESLQRSAHAIGNCELAGDLDHDLGMLFAGPHLTQPPQRGAAGHPPDADEPPDGAFAGPLFPNAARREIGPSARA